MVSRCGLILAVMGVVLVGMPAAALSDEVADLTAQIEQLQRENKTLKEQLGRNEQRTEQVLRRVQALEGRDEALSKQIKTVAERPAAPAVEELEKPLETVARLPTLTIKGFGDSGYSISFLRDGNFNDQNSAFYIGAQDLFFLSQLSERTTFLLETDFHHHEVTPFKEFDHLHLERAILSHQFSDLLGIKVGKTHTPLGYWNQTFHHGTWLQTSIFRPEIYEFEVPVVQANPEHGGYLPVHSIGIETFGTYALEPGEVKYSLGIYNGRGPTIFLLADISDLNDFKGVNALVGFKPHAIEGLEVGFDAYIDKIPNVRAEDVSPAPAIFTTNRDEPIDELILGWYGAYVHQGVELLGELFRIHHDVKSNNLNVDSWAGYVQGSYKLGKHTPYYRFDFINVDDSPFWFGAGDHFRNDTMHTFGVRWDVGEWHALKLEYTIRAEQFIREQDYHQITLNTSYTF